MGRQELCFTLPPALAPIKVAIFPLMKKDGMAKAGQRDLCRDDESIPGLEYDDGARSENVSEDKRIGTPFCVTVDYRGRIRGWNRYA